MLVLARRQGESLQIGDSITISVERIQKGSVRLGIKAPLDVPVTRDNAVDQEDRTEERIRNAIAAGEPLHELERKLDHEDACRPSEDDMISRSKAASKRMADAQRIRLLENGYREIDRSPAHYGPAAALYARYILAESQKIAKRTGNG
jgi:carbon storage regulator